MIKMKIQEFEEMRWFMHDAYDGAIVYSNQFKSHVSVCKPKDELRKEPFHNDEFER